MGKSSDSNGIKLDISRTIKVGIAFMTIMVFWEIYDTLMPIILQRQFGMSRTALGVIMGLDNLLAIFLLPFFGALSDKAQKKKLGRRTHYYLWGTIAAVILLIVMAGVEHFQYLYLAKEGVLSNPQLLVEYGFDAKFLDKSYQDIVALYQQNKSALTADQMVLYKEYSEALLNSQIQYAGVLTKANPVILICFISAICGLLVAMSAFRSPVVALMPDVTPKPLRSQANAIINLMGGVGSLVAIGIYKIFAKNRYQSYLWLYLTLACAMLIFLGIYMLLVKENKFVDMRVEEEKTCNIVDEQEEKGQEEKLSKKEMISFILILGTVFLWFMGYNAVKTHMSTYATSTLGFEDSFVATISLMNMIGGAIGLIPVAFLASKIGRKNTIIIGLIMATISFIPCFFLKATTPGAKILFPACFIIAGFGLVTINVNTFPMVTELSKKSNVGKFTGYYYIASMLAQVITPIFGGMFMDKIEPRYVFIYSVALLLMAIVTAAFIKHGDTRAPKVKTVEPLPTDMQE